MLRNYFAAFSLMFVVFIFGSGDSWACSCVGPRTMPGFQPCSVYWNADAVFIGTVEEIKNEIRETSKYSGAVVVRFTVEKALKGVEGGIVEIWTSQSGGMCGYPFQQGEKYFVYARRRDNGKLSEGLCGPTVLLKNAAQDLEYVKDLEAGEKGGRIYGIVTRFSQQSYTDLGSSVPLPGIEITLELNNQKLQTATNSEGKYEFRGIAPGTYKIYANLPKNFREIRRNDNLLRNRFVTVNETASRCDNENFTVTSLSTLEGRAIGIDNKSSAARIALIPLDESGKPVSSFWESVWIDPKTGNYIFGSVPPGRYLLGINPKNCDYFNPNFGNPIYPRMFFPGVGDIEKAEVITIAENENRQLGDFKLLPLLKERWFSGIVYSTDKKPIVGARVLIVPQNRNECFTATSVGETKTDEQGRFKLKGYESYKYQIQAHSQDVQSQRTLHSQPVYLPENGSVKDLSLIISPSF